MFRRFFQKQYSHFSFVSGVVIGLPIYITCKDYFGYIARVEGASMQPTLNPCQESNCDVVFLNSWITDYESFKRGEIVAIASPYHRNVSYIKRIIALEGDIVWTPRYKKSHVFIPKGHCWVEGDNKSASLDSNSFGPVSIGLIKAKATYIIWPPHRWQKLSFDMPHSTNNNILSVND
ncbi:mitochondrial inner membrane protease subunit 2 [Hydra vulgaris]|uniref:Mitochondrial inner membrane protease subunit 2 n=1 Tax=Hydra vulgaris TaxID=6087 RepID=A0ABM4CD97_HYDVU